MAADQEQVRPTEDVGHTGLAAGSGGADALPDDVTYAILRQAPGERMFTFSTSSQDGASVTCRNCGWVTRGRLASDVYPRAEMHGCSEGAIRTLAVFRVDAEHGFTVEFSNQPNAHSQQYDDEEERLTEALNYA